MSVLQKLVGHNFTMDITSEFLSKINSKKVLVIARSIREFDTFCDLAMELFEKEDKYEGCEFTYYNRPDSIRGMRFDSYLYFGTGALRSDLDLHLIKTSIKF